MNHPLVFNKNKPALSSTDQARLSAIAGGFPSLKAGIPSLSTSSVKVPGSLSVLPSGQITPAGIESQGNVFAFVVKGNFGFLATANSIHIFWDGTNGSQPLVIKRADGGSFSVPVGQITISGLNALTKYGFAPYVSVAQPQTVSFVAGDAGLPRFAFSPSASSDLLAQASQIQRLTINESLTNGFIYNSTNAGGTTMGTGSGSPTPPIYTGNAERTY